VRTALASRSDVVVVGESGNGIDAVDAIEQLAPDLVLLDVHMPGLDGFGVLQQIPEESRPAIVFVTAYDQYAIRAFEQHAIDYLLKPFDAARLFKALERARQWIARRPAVNEGVSRLLKTRHRERFVVKHAGRQRLVQADEIRWIEAQGNYVLLHANGGPFLLRETLSSIERTLNPARFLRVHRSALVVLDQVLSMQRQPSGDYELRLRSGREVTVRTPMTADGGAAVVAVANDLVAGIEFDPVAGIANLTPDRFQRLTTLPRSQRDDPPTHLLRLRTEDYLRGKLESLDGDDLVFSVLDQKKRLPRAAVARIIWLHPEDTDFGGGGAARPEREAEGGAKPPAEAAAAGLLVQGVTAAGRTTLVADRMEGTLIIGTSPAFGPSRIDTTAIDKLLIGGAVGTDDQPLPFAQWRLRLAPLPRALRDEE